MYDLADRLERLGDSARALAVLLGSRPTQGVTVRCYPVSIGSRAFRRRGEAR